MKWYQRLLAYVLSVPVTVFWVCVVVAFLTVSGCATYDAEERAYRDAIDAENWRMCELVYQQAGASTYHRDHEHNHRVRWDDIKKDLMDNRCKVLLGDYWAEY